MNPGITTEELARKLTDQQKAKHDYLAEAREIRFEIDPIHSKEETTLQTYLTLNGPESLLFQINANCHKQIADWSKIPRKYYSYMMKESPHLLRNNVNHWLQNSGNLRMIRTLNDTARAFLSDSYRRLDNFDMANAVLPVLAEVPDMEIVSCELTEHHMYIKVVFPRLETEVVPGDVVQSGLVISNSEVGMGMVKIQHLVYRLVCTNGMVSEYGKSEKHLKRNTGYNSYETESGYELCRPETLKQEDKAFWMKIQDVVRGFATNAEYLTRIVAKMREAKGQRLKGDPVKAVEELSNTLSLMEVEKSLVLTYLLKGGDLSKYGMANAVTNTAENVRNYDRATELESLGSNVINLPNSQWRKIAEAGIDN